MSLELLRGCKSRSEAAREAKASGGTVYERVPLGKTKLEAGGRKVPAGGCFIAVAPGGRPPPFGAAGSRWRLVSALGASPPGYS